MAPFEALSNRLMLTICLMAVPSLLLGQALTTQEKQDSIALREKQIDAFMKKIGRGKYNPNNRGYVYDVPNDMKYLPHFGDVARDSIQKDLVHDLRLLARASGEYYRANGVFTTNVRSLLPYLKHELLSADALIKISADYEGGLGDQEDALLHMWIPGAANCEIQWIAPNAIIQPKCLAD